MRLMSLVSTDQRVALVNAANPAALIAAAARRQQGVLQNVCTECGRPYAATTFCRVTPNGKHYRD